MLNTEELLRSPHFLMRPQCAVGGDSPWRTLIPRIREYAADSYTKFVGDQILIK
ncbi:hypothetical protein ACFUEJ_22345 [Gordonia sp. NPDC057258]|uniref:hypothetical protein n=1 Tax=unclassified Gordonia (in: high G+C Gram-positive bacteria) TaxID=2657482 RepID=UPI003644AD76